MLNNNPYFEELFFQPLAFPLKASRIFHFESIAEVQWSTTGKFLALTTNYGYLLVYEVEEQNDLMYDRKVLSLTSLAKSYISMPMEGGFIFASFGFALFLIIFVLALYFETNLTKVFKACLGEVPNI